MNAQRLFATMLLAAAACSTSVAAPGSGSEGTTAPPIAPPRVSPIAPPTTPPLPVVPASLTKKFTTADICASPCVLLAEMTIEDATLAYCNACSVDAQCEDAFVPRSCEAEATMRNCIFASHGFSFKKKKWQETFGKQAWYRPNPRYSDKLLSRAARQNIEALRGEGCVRDKYDVGVTLLEPVRKTDDSRTFEYDFDGDGLVEQLVITADEATLNAVIVPGNNTFVDEVAVLDIDRKNKRVEFALLPQINDDIADYQIFAYENAKIISLGAVAGARMKVKGNGTLVGVSGGCGQTTTTTWRLKGSRIIRGKSTTTGKYDGATCSACPYVFVDGDEGYQFVDTIVRNLVGKDVAALQYVQLPATQRTTFKIRIAERESEVSYLDEIYVTVGGIRFDASTRQLDARGPQQGDAVTLHYGGQIDLTFDIGVHAANADIKLWAHGYYQPMLSAPQ